MDDALLLIAATPLETRPLRDTLDDLEARACPWGELFACRLGERSFHLAHLGVAKVNTAAGLALAIRELQPSCVIQFGIGGAFVGSFLSIGMVAVAEREIHLDTGVRTDTAWLGMDELGFPLLVKDAQYFNVFPTDAGLTEALVKATQGMKAVFGTSETVTGSLDEARVLQERFDLSVESMEGAAAAQVCLALGVPFSEVRGISNIVGERDKRAWSIPRAVKAVNEAMLAFLRTSERA